MEIQVSARKLARWLAPEAPDRVITWVKRGLPLRRSPSGRILLGADDVAALLAIKDFGPRGREAAELYRLALEVLEEGRRSRRPAFLLRDLSAGTVRGVFGSDLETCRAIVGLEDFEILALGRLRDDVEAALRQSPTLEHLPRSIAPAILN